MEDFIKTFKFNHIHIKILTVIRVKVNGCYFVKNDDIKGLN